MGLQVWLPLNGNAEQQGLSSITMTGSPNSWANGKIGQCAHFAGNTANVIYNNTTDFNYTDNFSWAVWIKTNFTGTTAQYAFTNGRADTGGYGYGIQCVSSANCYVRFGNQSYTIPVTGGEWTHLAFTKKGTLITIYKNGSVHTSQTFNGTLPTYSDGNGLGLGCFHYSGNIYPFYGDLNDFRIYDHVLSPREVKEISKGLVLHYPLSAPGGENLARNTYNKLEYHTDDFSAVNKTIGYPISGFQGKELLLVASEKGLTLSYDISIPFIYRDTSQSLQRCGCYIPFTIKNNSTGTTINYYAHHSQAGIATSHNTYSKTNSLNSISSSATASAPDTSFNGHYSRTIFPNEFSSLSDFFANPDNYTVTGGTSINTEIRGAYIKGECTISNVKLELGSTATPWLPNPADAEYSALGFDDGIEYDVSGYGYNGTKVGTITYDSDTPKYNTSTKFTDNSYIKHKLPEQMYYATYSFWVKASSYTNYGAIYITFGSPGIGYSPWLSVNTESCKVWAYFGGNSPYYTKGASGSVTTNEWHHCVYVWDNGVAQWYLDGEKCGNAVTYTEKTYIQNTDNATIGNSYTGTNWNGTKFNGQISDFRIYATALSADDILELYHTPISLSNNGALLTQGEYVES